VGLDPMEFVRERDERGAHLVFVVLLCCTHRGLDPKHHVAEHVLVLCHAELFCYNMAIPISTGGRCNGHQICRGLGRILKMNIPLDLLPPWRECLKSLPVGAPEYSMEPSMSSGGMTC
jgi:hypothetical protein